MNKERVDEVLMLCEELKKRAEAWKEAEDECFCCCPKESGALRRISMELSRALSDMSRP